MSTNQAPSQTVDTADYVLSKPPISDSKKPTRALSVLCRYFPDIVQPLAEMKDRVSGICKIRLSNISSQQPNISFLKCLVLFKDFEKEITHVLKLPISCQTKVYLANKLSCNANFHPGENVTIYYIFI